MNKFQIGDLVKYDDDNQNLYGIVVGVGLTNNNNSSYYVTWFDDNFLNQSTEWLEKEFELIKIS